MSAVKLNIMAWIEILNTAMSMCLSREALVEVFRLLILYLASSCLSHPDSSNCVGVILRSPRRMNGRFRVFLRIFICCSLVWLISPMLSPHLR